MSCRSPNYIEIISVSQYLVRFRLDNIDGVVICDFQYHSKQDVEKAIFQLEAFYLFKAHIKRLPYGWREQEYNEVIYEKNKLYR